MEESGALQAMGPRNAGHDLGTGQHLQTESLGQEAAEETNSACHSLAQLCLREKGCTA